MTDIAPISRPSHTQLSSAQSYTRGQESADTAPSRGSDSAEFSVAAQYLSKLQELPEIRHDLVADIKAQIEAGTYETEEKLDAAIDALSEDLA